MGFVSNLLGTAKAGPEVNKRLAEVRENVREGQQGGQIRFDPELIDKLKADHKELFRIFGALVEAS